MSEIDLSAFHSSIDAHARKFSIRNYFKIIAVLIAVFIIINIFGAFLTALPFIFLPVLIAVFILLYLRSRKYKQAINQSIRQVAKDNGWEVKKPMPADIVKSEAAFNLATDTSIGWDEPSDLSGELNNLPFWMSLTDNGTILLIDSKKNLPGAVFITSVLDSGLLKAGFDEAFKSQKLRPVKLEGDFDKYFRLYADPSKVVEVLSVVAPDFMASLIDNGLVSSVILADHYCLIQSSGIDKGRLKALLLSGQAMAKELAH